MTPKKQTIERIKKALEDENWVLLSAYYKAKRIRIRYLCAKNHENEMTWSNFQAGCRCRTCKKITDELVREEFAKVGWTPLEKYKNARTYMKCRCSQSHIFTVSWAAFIRKSRTCGCPQCKRSNNVIKEILKNVV